MLKLRRSSWLMLLQKQSMPSQVWYLRYGLRIYMSNPQMAARHFPREVHSVSLKRIDTNEFLFDMFLEFINILRNSQLKRVRGTSPLAVAWPHCPQVATAVSLSHGLRSEGAVGLEMINLDWDGREWHLSCWFLYQSLMFVITYHLVSLQNPWDWDTFFSSRAHPELRSTEAFAWRRPAVASSLYCFKCSSLWQE